MRGFFLRILVGLIIIYAGYLIYQGLSRPSASKTAEQTRKPVSRPRLKAGSSEAEMMYLRLNAPSDSSLIEAGKRDLFSYYQKPVIREVVKPPEETLRPVIQTPIELPATREPRTEPDKPDPKLNNFSFVAYFGTPKGTMVVLKEGQEEYAGSIGGVIKGDVEILKVKNSGTGQDYVEINVVDSKRPARKIYFNPINF